MSRPCARPSTKPPTVLRGQAPAADPRRRWPRQGLDGFLVPHEDEHQNEYLPAANDRLAWATGFTGSAGAAVVLKDQAAVFVDGRYTLQVRDQVDADLFEIRDLVEGGVPAYLETRAEAAPVIGYDPRLHSPDALARLKRAAAKAGAELKPVDDQPARPGLGRERPAAAARRPVVPHPDRVRRRDQRLQARAGRRRRWPTRAPTPRC